ncbi:hypothetical protein PHMEG_00018667 [Phytophthora megakarya]|uniref:DUF6570 domain-containing protein n=1 Tax=Phytophthora megakarya TaxID=4795 RepID=A0A225VT86_9STRA|nr:hypothetical protein PHMEG_00018667 [Phytophthora megakarya]
MNAYVPFVTALSRMMLSTKGLILSHESCATKLRVCNGCYGALQKHSLPKFSIRNGVFVGELDRHLPQSTIIERMMSQLVTVVALTRVMQGGAHRSIRSHCMAFDATPGPPATLLPATLDKLSPYKVLVAGSITTAQCEKIQNMYAVRGNTLQAFLAFYKRNSLFYADVDISEETVDASSASAFADAVLDFNDSIPVKHITRIDREQSRMGSESDSVVEDEGEVIERSMGFVNEASTRPDSFQTVTELSASSSASERRFFVRNSSTFLRDNDESIYWEKCFHLCSRLVVAIPEKIALYQLHRKLYAQLETIYQG